MLLKKYEVVTYTFSEYRNLVTMENLNKFDRVIAHIKKNKTMYLKLVILLAMTIDKSSLTVLASGSLETSLNTLSTKLVGILIAFAKVGCMGMGLKAMVVVLLNGGNMKEASIEGIQYWIGYIFLQLYPFLYDIAEGFEL